MSPHQSEDDQSEENSESKFGGDADMDALGSSTGHGSGQPAAPLTNQEERALVQLQEALDCLVGEASVGSDMDCSAYMTACKECPELVSNPTFRIPFLRRFNMDPWAAAKRLVAYWTERKFLFGDAAFRPLTVASLPDFFQEASIVLLPHRDKEGRSVIFLDRLKLNYEQLRDDMGRARCLFYLLDLAAQQNPTASTQGVVILALVAKPPLCKSIPKAKDVSWWDSFFQSFSNLYEWKFPKHCQRMATQALPIHIAMIHMVTLPQTSGVGYLRTAAVNVCLNMLGSYFNNITKIHHGGKKSEHHEDDEEPETDSNAVDQATRLHQASLLRQLRPYGLFKRQLPEVMGGLFTMQNFEHWVQRHASQELRALATKEELLQRKRQVNLLHSRQKRQRRRQELDELNTENELLKSKNQQAKAEACRLEALLRQANDIVRKVERGQSFDVTAPYLSVNNPSDTAMDSFSAPILGESQIGHAQTVAEPIPLAVSSTLQYARPPLALAPVQAPSRRPLASPHVYEVPDTLLSHDSQLQMLSDSRTPLPGFLLDTSLQDAPRPAVGVYTHEHSIPSAADLCLGFSDDEDDHAFKDQIQNVADPQPASLWSSMIGLFRPHPQPQLSGSHLESNNETGLQQASVPLASVFGNRDQYAQQDQHSELNRPATFATAGPVVFDAPGWQVTTTTSAAPLTPQQQPYDNHDNIGKDPSSEPLPLWHETSSHSPTPPPRLTDYTDRSSPASSAVKPSTTTSLSPGDADWYSW